MADKDHYNHSMKGFHHGYLGLLILYIGFVMIWFADHWFCPVLTGTAGLFIFIDDFYQHIKGRSHPDYKSPLHRLYGLVYCRVKWLRRLNAFVDSIFGK